MTTHALKNVKISVETLAQPKKLKSLFPAAEKARNDAIDDASKFLMRRRLHAGRPSTLRKLRKFARIADMVRPAEFKRKLKTGERQVLGAHGWQDAA